MGIVASLFIGVEQIVNIPLSEGPMWNLVEIGLVVSEKTFKKLLDCTHVYSPRAGADTLGEVGDKILITKSVW